MTTNPFHKKQLDKILDRIVKKMVLKILYLEIETK